MKPSDEITIERAHMLAGRVKRYHTVFTVQTQTVAEHVYNLMRIYIAIFGTAPGHVFRNILYHDFEEHILGDPPHWICDYTALKQAYHDATEVVEKQFGIPGLNYTDELQVKICDWIEALEFMIMELELGNNHFRANTERLWTKLMEFMAHEFSAEDLERILDYLDKSGTDHRYSCIIDGIHRGE